ncbi:MAG: DUF86 domain-containing protein [Oscillospiraceae bacterium]|jgi:uncharacterized protein with HEPN domain|nr:DUF86 domain-containing protein [Oscillospiraceae bacterium]
MKINLEEALKQMWLYCCEIPNFIGGLNYEIFETTTVVQYPAVFCLIQIGELANYIQKNFETDKLNIPFEPMYGLRCHLVHEFCNVELPLVWDTLQNDIAPLEEQLRQILGETSL